MLQLSTRWGTWLLGHSLRVAIVVSLLAALGATLGGIEAGAQVPTPLANPNLQFLSSGGIGQFDSMVVQADGKLVVANDSGGFARVGGVVGRRQVARFNLDGTLDNSFTADTDGASHVAIGANYIYVYGLFATVGGASRNGLARISIATGQVDNNWNPALNSAASLLGLVVDSTDTAYVFGTAMNIGGLTGVSLAKLDAVTGAGVATWSPSLPTPIAISRLAVSQSNLYVIGTTTAVSQANRIFKVSTANGAVDGNFSPDLNAIDFFIAAAITAGNGDLYIAGPQSGTTNINFGNHSYAAANKFLRLSGATGQVAPGWSPPATQNILSIAASSDSIYAIHGSAYGDSSTRWGAMRYDLSTGAANGNWANLAAGNFNGLFVGKIAGNGTDVYVGGRFAFYGDQRRAGAAKLNTTDGSVLPFSPDLREARFPSIVATSLLDGSSVVAGDFSEINGLSFDGLARIGADGAVDNSWRPPTIDGGISSARTMGSYLYISGLFNHVGNAARPGFARFRVSDGGLDTAFQPPATDGFVNYYASDGADVFIMGAFRSVAGNPRYCLAKLDGVSGAFIPQWTPVINSPANVIAANCPAFQRIEVSDGFVYVSVPSSPTTIQIGSFARHLARFDTQSGLVDPSWDPNPNGAVIRLVSFHNQLYAYGAFTNVFGIPTQNIARFDSFGGFVDASFVNSSTEFNSVNGFTYDNLQVGNAGVFVTYTQSNLATPPLFQRRIRRLSISNGAVDNGYSPMVGSESLSPDMFAAYLSDDKLLVYGGFTNVAGQARLYYAYLPTSASVQVALPLPNLKILRNATINGVATQADGKIYVTGDFTTVDGLARQTMVRLNANGSLDSSFSLTLNGNIFSVKAGGGFLFLYGDFTQINGVARAGLARINTTTGAVDASWDPNPRPVGNISDMAADGNGNLYVYGGSMTIGGVSGVQVAKVLTSGQADPAFRGNPNLGARDILLAANGALYVTGDVIPQQSSQNLRIYKLNPLTGAIDPTWSASNQAIDMDVHATAVSATGDVYIAGQISGNEVVQSGQTYTATKPFVKLGAANGASPSQWNPPVANAHFALAIDSAGSVYSLRGIFYSDAASSIPTKYDANTGAIDSNFNALEAVGGNGDIGILAMPDGLLIGGAISSYGAARIGPIAKLDLASGALLGGFSTNLQTPGYLTLVHQLAAGPIIIGGFFNSIDGVTINNLARLNSDGTLDRTWTTGMPGFVASIRELGGSLYLSGFQPTSNPNQIEFVTKLDPVSGARDPQWNLVLDGQMRAAAIDTNTNSLYIIGGFNKVNNQTRPCVAKVDSRTGALDTAWSPQITSVGFGINCGRSIALNNGYVYLGFFNQHLAGGSPRLIVNGQNRFLARVSPITGVADSSWDPNPNGPVSALRDTGNQIYLAGGFSNISGLTTRVARFNPVTGAFDSSFANLLSSIPAPPQNIRVQAGNVFLGGIGAGSVSTNDFSTAKHYVWKLRSDGSQDFAWTPELAETDAINAFSTSLSSYSTDKILVGGGFQHVGSQVRSGLAAFSVATLTPLTLNMRGQGTVIMQSSGALTTASCSDCSTGSYPFSFDTGSSVTLTAASTATSTFVGWSAGTGGASACSGTGACVVSLSAAASVNAVFRQVKTFSEQ